MTGDPLDSFRVGASPQKDQGMIKGWNFHPHLPNFWEGRSFGDLSSSPMVNDLINHTYIMKLPQKTKWQGWESFQVSAHTAGGST